MLAEGMDTPALCNDRIMKGRNTEEGQPKQAPPAYFLWKPRSPQTPGGRPPASFVAASRIACAHPTAVTQNTTPE